LAFSVPLNNCDYSAISESKISVENASESSKKSIESNESMRNGSKRRIVEDEFGSMKTLAIESIQTEDSSFDSDEVFHIRKSP